MQELKEEGQNYLKEEGQKRTRTVGSHALEQQLKPAYTVPIKDFGEDVLQKDDSYMKKLFSSVQNGLDVFGIDIVYIEVHTWRERSMHNVIRQKMRPRVSCPTPTYGQSAWKFDKNDEKLQLLWTLPDRETCITLLHNVLNVHEDEKKVLRNVLDFYDKKLDSLCYEENKRLDKIL